MTKAQLRALVQMSLRDPQQAARALMGLALPPAAVWMAFGAIVALSAALSTLAELLFYTLHGGSGLRGVAPLPMAIAQGVLILYGAWAISFFGRMFGGQGTFANALLLVSWIEAMLLMAQLLQILVMIIVPSFAVVGSIALILLLFWLLIHFTMALHGFESVAKTGCAVLAFFIGSGMVFGIVLVSLGVTPAAISM